MVYPYILKKQVIFRFCPMKIVFLGRIFNRDRTVLTGIITNYLTQHRRLVVPQLGTFVVKVPEGGVVFSELLKRETASCAGCWCSRVE